MRVLGIIVLVIVVIALLWLASKLIFKKSDGLPCKTDDNQEGTIVNGECVKTTQQTGPNIDQSVSGDTISAINVPKLVNENDAPPAPDPNVYFKNLSTSNILAHSVIIDQKKTKNNPTQIKFTTAFSTPVQNHVWHNHWIYKFKNRTTSDSGVDTRVYEVDRNELPGEIRVLTPDKCSVYKFWISGQEYGYLDTKIEKMGPATLIYCVYGKK